MPSSSPVRPRPSGRHRRTRSGGHCAGSRSGSSPRPPRGPCGWSRSPRPPWVATSTCSRRCRPGTATVPACRWSSCCTARAPAPPPSATSASATSSPPRSMRVRRRSSWQGRTTDPPAGCATAMPTRRRSCATSSRRWLADRGFDADRRAVWAWSRGGYGALRLALDSPDYARAWALFSPAVSSDDPALDDLSALDGVPIGVLVRDRRRLLRRRPCCRRPAARCTRGRGLRGRRPHPGVLERPHAGRLRLAGQPARRSLTRESVAVRSGNP